MKLGVNLWTVFGWRPREEVSREVLTAIAAMGSEAVELTLDEDLHSYEALIARREELAGWAEDLGLDIPSIGTTLLWRYNLGSQGEEERGRAIEIVRHGCRVTNAYGAKVFLVVAGQQEPGVEYARTYETAIASLQAVADHAADLGVVIGVENVKTSFIGSPGEYSRFIADVDRPAVQAYLDFGNGASVGPSYPENWITAVRGQIAAVQAKDYDRGLDAYVCCGQGSLDWQAVFSALEDVGYNGYLLVETPPKAGRESPSVEAGLHAAETSLRWLERFA